MKGSPTDAPAIGSSSSSPLSDASTAAADTAAAPAGESKWFSFAPKNPFTFSFGKAAAKDEGAELQVQGEDDDLEAGRKGKGAASALSKKEQELAKKEAELKKKEAQLEEAQRLSNPRIPNFPWCWPMMYHKINVDIPPANRTTMKLMFQSWWLLILALAVNSCACFSIMVSHVQGNTTGAKDFGVSIMYLLGVLIASFFLWYRPVYNAYRKDSSMLFYMYFFFGGWNVLFIFYMIVGIPSSGSAGIINTISIVTADAYLAGVICCVNSGCWILLGLFSAYLYRTTHYYYRVKGLTVDDARNEAVKNVAGTGVLQGVAGSYVKSNTGFFK
ncbi:hypothetical protein HK101_010741 [Irineochytrium annulatum]|nr:hypothetical protein HK101_010741 [Irineochytrium annulatum]